MTKFDTWQKGSGSMTTPAVRQRAFQSRQRQSRVNLRLVAPKAAKILGLAAQISDPVKSQEIINIAVEIWNLSQAALPGSPLDHEGKAP